MLNFTKRLNAVLRVVALTLLVTASGESVAAWGGLAAQGLSSTQTVLNWTASGDWYRVQRLSGCCSWITLSEFPDPITSQPTYTDSGLSGGTVYSYRVQRQVDGLWTDFSNTASAATSIPNSTSGSMTYEYDPFGNLIKTTTGSIVTSFGYDTRGRKISMSDPDMGAWTYTYNALGELIRQFDARSNTTTMSYDLLSRMVSRSEPDLNASWTFDSCTKGIGKLCQASAANGYSRTHAYDAYGRPSSTTTTIDTTYTVTIAYDSAGRVDTVTYPTGFAAQNVYNAYGYLQSIRNAGAPSTVYWTASSVAAAGGVLAESLGGVINSSRTFDAMDRMATVNTTSPSGTLQNDTYSFDYEGNITQRAELLFTENFSYDSRGRVTSSSGPGLPTKSFDYDAVGNITYKNDAGLYGYSPSRPHAVSNISGSVNASYSYDGNGNLTSGNGRTYTYASFNKPTSISAGLTTYTYTYGAEYQRAKLAQTSASTFYYVNSKDGTALLYEKEVKTTGLIEHKHYITATSGVIGVYLSRSDTTTETRYYLRDYLQSNRLVAMSTGAAYETLSYDTYGRRRQPNGTDAPTLTFTSNFATRGYTGHEHMDAITNINMNGRVYDALLARFMTPDPLIGAQPGPQSFNRYAYVGNNPLKFIDPTGYAIENTSLLLCSTCAQHPSTRGFIYTDGSYRLSGMNGYGNGAGAANGGGGKGVGNVQVAQAAVLLTPMYLGPQGMTDARSYLEGLGMGAYSVLKGDLNALRFLARGTGLLGPEELAKWQLEGMAVDAAASIGERAMGLALKEYFTNSIFRSSINGAASQGLQDIGANLTIFDVGRIVGRSVTGACLAPAGGLALIGDTTRAVENVGVDGGEMLRSAIFGESGD